MKVKDSGKKAAEGRRTATALQTQTRVKAHSLQADTRGAASPPAPRTHVFLNRVGVLDTQDPLAH